MRRVPYGKIGEALIANPGSEQRGKPKKKKRPVVVIDERREFPHGSTIEVVVITTTRDDPDGEYLPVPWHPDRRRCSTRLTEESWAAIHWVERVDVSELEVDRLGHIKFSSLSDIVVAVRDRDKPEE